jgi:hypothetical protein
MKKFFLGPALAALAMFVFGFLYWGVSPLPYKVLNRVDDDAAAAAALAKIFPSSGTYFLPGLYLDRAKHEELMTRGPIAEVHFVNSGLPMMDPKILVKGYLHCFALCVLLALMLNKLAPAFQSWSGRAKFCAEVGLIVALYQYVYAIWWHHALAWVSMQAIYDFLEFVIAGLVLAKFVTPKENLSPAPVP